MLEIRNRAGVSVVAKNVRLGLALFLLLLIYDGALRKWVFLSFEQIIFIAKDALLFGMFIYAMVHRRRQINSLMPPAERLMFVLYVCWVLLESGNFNLPGVLVGIWGIRTHLLYASLILLLPLAFNNLNDLFRLLVKIYPWMVVPVCALAFVQLTLPADSFINQQVRGGIEAISYFGDASLVRVTGTFSYITGMAAFVQAGTLLGIGLFMGGVRSRWFLIGLGFALAALPATGSRGVIVVAAVSVLIMLFAALASRLIGISMMVRTVALITLLGVISLTMQDAAWIAIQQRAIGAATSSGDSERILTVFTNAFNYFDVAGFFGFGSGSASLGSVFLVRDVAPFSWLPVGNQFEEESGRIVLELGIIGWLLSQSMRIVFFFWSMRLVMNGRTRTVRLAAILALPMMAFGMYVGSGVFAPPVGTVYYWFCVALLTMAQYEHRHASAERARLRAQQFQAVVE